MKIPNCLGASVLLAIAIPAACASAQFYPLSRSEFHPHHPPAHASPMVRIITPQEGASFLLGDKIQICADADYFTNPIASVEFSADTNVLGVVSNGLWRSDTYCLSVSNLAAGPYQLTAVATDTGGISVTSPPVDITVVTDLPPKVAIFQPRDGAVILGPTNIQISDGAYDPDGTVASVEFFEGTNDLGTVPTPPVTYVTNHFGIFPIKAPYSLTWSNVAPGAYVLTAVATDNAGVASTSAPVSITVVTDLPPHVRIVFPERGAAYCAPATIHVTATASDPDGTIAQVQFFSGSDPVGVVIAPVFVTNWDDVDGFYSLTLSNVAAGSYTLTAVATDNAGVNSTSAPVAITVVSPPPPKVIITQPHYGETFYNAPLNINVCSWEKNFTNPVVNVQFFAGTNGIGWTTNSPSSCIVWSNVPPGAYLLNAVATDSQNLSVTSPPVGIIVTTNPPPKWSWEDRW